MGGFGFWSYEGNRRFSGIIGGSKNTVNGRYSTAMGFYAKARGDYSVAIGLNSNPSSPCIVTDDYTLGICADAVEVNGMDLVSLFSGRRELSERHEVVEKQTEELAKTYSALAKEFSAQEEMFKHLNAELNEYDAMVKEYGAMQAQLAELLSR